MNIGVVPPEKFSGCQVFVVSGETLKARCFHHRWWLDLGEWPTVEEIAAIAEVHRANSDKREDSQLRLF